MAMPSYADVFDEPDGEKRRARWMPGTSSRTCCRCARPTSLGCRWPAREGAVNAAYRGDLARAGYTAPAPEPAQAGGNKESKPWIATVDRRPLVSYTLVRWHLIASSIFLAISLLGGLAYSFQLNNMYPFAGVERLSPGRVRMAHTQHGGVRLHRQRLHRRHAVRDPAPDQASDPVGPAGLLIFVARQFCMVLTPADSCSATGRRSRGETPISSIR